jgi:hypothetical protein
MGADQTTMWCFDNRNRGTVRSWVIKAAGSMHNRCRETQVGSQEARRQPTWNGTQSSPGHAHSAASNGCNPSQRRPRKTDTQMRACACTLPHTHPRTRPCPHQQAGTHPRTSRSTHNKLPNTHDRSVNAPEHTDRHQILRSSPPAQHQSCHPAAAEGSWVTASTHPQPARPAPALHPSHA